MGNDGDRCPFLVPVMDDRLWMYPMPAYCRRPGERLKVPGRHAFLSICNTPEYMRCPDFRTSIDGLEHPATRHRAWC